METDERASGDPKTYEQDEPQHEDGEDGEQDEEGAIRALMRGPPRGALLPSVPPAGGLPSRAPEAHAGPLAAEGLCYQLGHLGGVRRRPDAGATQGLALRLSGALAAGDYSPGVAHGLALRRGEARDVGHDRGLHLALDELGGALLGVAPDLADHHHAVGFGVLLELAQDLDKVRADDRVAPDADGRALADAPLGKLVDNLVSERPAAADDPDPARRKDVARHDGDVGLAGREHPWAVRPDERGVLRPYKVRHPHHVVDGD